MIELNEENNLWLILGKIKELDRNSVDKLDLYIWKAKNRNYDNFSIYFYAFNIGFAERIFEYPELINCYWEYTKLLWVGSPELQLKMFDEMITGMDWYRKERFV
jgi:hypothetical protein